MARSPLLIIPDWPAAAHIGAVSTTRHGGVSHGAWQSLNLGDHVGDDAAAVAENRQRLVALAGLPAQPRWLTQVHGTTVVGAGEGAEPACGDAVVSRDINLVCGVMTADCLPILLCDRRGTVVAAVHAGWRGLLAGVIEATIDKMAVAGSEILAWFGPAIGPQAFEVGSEVVAAFCAHDRAATAAFTPHRDRWLADIYQLARQRLAPLGVTDCYGGDHCTWQESDLFFSYRRDGISGRMASLIWLRDASTPPVEGLI
jgi:polyphenol oxidase